MPRILTLEGTKPDETKSSSRGTAFTIVCAVLAVAVLYSILFGRSK